MFDDDGRIRNLQRVFDGLGEGIAAARRDPKPNSMLGNLVLRGAPDVAFMAGDFESARRMPDALRDWMLDMGAFDASPLPEFKWTDWCFGIVSRPDSLAMGCLADTDRYEFFDAQLFTNAFRMDDPEGDYELSVRSGFDAYDGEAGSLRVRLAKGGASGGRYAWPEEGGSWPPLDDKPSPCIAGEFDSNGRITVRARPGREGERALDPRLVTAYPGFVEDVVGLAESRGLAVDNVSNVDPEGEGADDKLACYRADATGCWLKIGIWVHYDLRPNDPSKMPERVWANMSDEVKEKLKSRKRDDPPIRVSRSGGYPEGENFEDFPPALAKVEEFIDKCIARADGALPPDELAREREVKRVFFDFVVDVGKS